MKTVFAILAIALSCSFSLQANGKGHFPMGPSPELTPGSLCDRPTERRYPEHIDYCRRNVDGSLKQKIIRQYDQELGYNIGQMDRQQFKIDHYIPLCAGGSNQADNLWPQHRSVYKITDPLEQILCEKMALGRLKQADAVQLIRKAKNDLPQTDDIIAYVRSL